MEDIAGKGSEFDDRADATHKVITGDQLIKET